MSALRIKVDWATGNSWRASTRKANGVKMVLGGGVAAINHDRAQEEMALIDKPGADRLAGEIAAPD